MTQRPISVRPAWAPLAWIDPEALFRAGPARAPHAFWLDAGSDATDGWSWMGLGEPEASFPDDVTVGGGGAPLCPGGFAGGWVGWASYDDAASLAGAPAARDSSAPSANVLAVSRLVAFDHAAQEAWVIASAGSLEDAVAEVAAWVAGSGAPAPAGAPPRRATTARHRPGEYAELIERCRAAIRAGDAYQLCLTTRFEVAASASAVDPVATYLRLRSALPAHHGGFIRVGEHALLSASPETFLAVADGIVRTRPIKGTRPRSDDPVVDAAKARALAESPKEQAENVMIVDLMRNDLQRVCAPGSVAVERLLEVESYPAVHQLVSTVAGRLLPGTTFGVLLAATFPAGSMTGAPKIAAMTLLHGNEGGPRGVYAGCFGWLGHDGRADLAMTIRSIVVHPGGAYVGAGGGITWLSDAADEVAEVAVKARGPLAALGAALPVGW